MDNKKKEVENIDTEKPDLEAVEAVEADDSEHSGNVTKKQLS